MPLFDQPGELVPYYLNAADLLLLTSEYEGSVNIIKEAMACNLQVVSTDVGDVAENLTSVNGSYVCKHNPIDISDGILKALMYKGHLNGRNKLVLMGLDSMTISQRLLAIYEKVINGK
jgi:glycosyltransferase involved in cell wall biosynthesis